MSHPLAEVLEAPFAMLEMLFDWRTWVTCGVIFALLIAAAIGLGIWLGNAWL